MATPLHDAIQRWQRNQAAVNDLEAIRNALRRMAWRVKATKRYKNVNWIDIDALVNEGLDELRRGGAISKELDKISKGGAVPLPDPRVCRVLFFQLSECVRNAGGDKGRNVTFELYKDALSTTCSPVVGGAVYIALAALRDECAARNLPYDILRTWITVVLSPPQKKQQLDRYIDRFGKAAKISRDAAKTYDGLFKPLVYKQITDFESYYSRTSADISAFVLHLVADC